LSWERSVLCHTCCNMEFLYHMQQSCVGTLFLTRQSVRPGVIRPFEVFSMFSVRGRIGFKLWKVKQNTLNRNLTCMFRVQF
jgi:hypothetical protein